jgi:hypothetical protein
MVVDPSGGDPDPSNRDDGEEPEEQPGEDPEDRAAALRERVPFGGMDALIRRGRDGHRLAPYEAQGLGERSRL